MTTYRSDSEVAVCNQALGLIQQPPIVSLDERNSKAARNCKLHYPLTRDRLLKDYRWNFNTRRISLVSLEAPLFGYTHAHQKPADVLRILEVHGCTDEQWVVEGEALLINRAAPVYARVLKLIPEPRNWDAHFEELLTLELGEKLAPALARNRGLSRDKRERLKELRATAKSVDAREAREELPETVSEFIACRSV